jgi:hypothetical protein
VKRGKKTERGRQTKYKENKKKGRKKKKRAK